MATQKSFMVALGVVGLAGVAFIASRVLGGGTPSIPANVAVLAADTAGFRGYLLGDPAAPVEVTEYADFQCGACGAFEVVQFPSVKTRLIDSGKLRFRYRDFPLEMHPHARLASHAAACADDQQKFWEMKSGIYRRQNDWGGIRSTGRFGSAGDAYDVLTEIAKATGLEMDSWSECMTSTKHAGRIQASLQEALAVGAGSTPTFLINGRLYPGMTADEMSKLVDSIAAAGSPAP
jgi:protein-disulfide isomerase